MSIPEAIASDYIIQPCQGIAFTIKKYENSIKSVWLTIDDGSSIKIYQQKRGVRYADYKARKYYISVHEVKLESTNT